LEVTIAYKIDPFLISLSFAKTAILCPEVSIGVYMYT
jgi:hypothetical protein